MRSQSARHPSGEKMEKYLNGSTGVKHAAFYPTVLLLVYLGDKRTLHCLYGSKRYLVVVQLE